MLKKWKRISQTIEAQGASMLLLSLQPEDRKEQELCRRLHELTGTAIVSASFLQEAVSVLSEAALVLSERYHGALAALVAETPFVALRLQEGDKLDELARECGYRSTTLSELQESDVLLDNVLEFQEGMQNKKKELMTLVKVGEDALRSALKQYGH